MNKLIGVAYAATCLTVFCLVVYTMYLVATIVFIGVPTDTIVLGTILTIGTFALGALLWAALHDEFIDLGSKVLWDLNASKRRTQEAYDQLANTKSKGDNS